METGDETAERLEMATVKEGTIPLQRMILICVFPKLTVVGSGMP